MSQLDIMRGREVENLRDFDNANIPIQPLTFVQVNKKGKQILHIAIPYFLII